MRRCLRFTVVSVCARKWLPEFRKKKKKNKQNFYQLLSWLSVRAVVHYSNEVVCLRTSTIVKIPAATLILSKYKTINFFGWNWKTRPKIGTLFWNRISMWMAMVAFLEISLTIRLQTGGWILMAVIMGQTKMILAVTCLPLALWNPKSMMISVLRSGPVPLFWWTETATGCLVRKYKKNRTETAKNRQKLV